MSFCVFKASVFVAQLLIRGLIFEPLPTLLAPFIINIRIPAIVTVLAFMGSVSGFQYLKRDNGCGDLELGHLFFCCGKDNGRIGTTS
jgi:hypothetical protein